MGGKQGLQYDPSPFSLGPRQRDGIHQRMERMFAGTEIRQMQSGVGMDEPHKSCG